MKRVALAAIFIVVAGVRADLQIGPQYKESDFLTRIRRLTVEGRRAGEGYWSPEREAAVLDEIRAEIDTAQRQVEQMERPEAAAIFDHVYETLSPRLDQQRAEAIDDAR